MRFLLKEIYQEKQKKPLPIRDKKLIQLLIQDGRMPISQLAKKLKISDSAIVQKIKALKEKNILLDPVMYTNLQLIENQHMHLIQIKTLVGINTKQTTKNLLKIKGAAVALWYTGEYNLLLAVFHKDPQIIIENIEKEIPIHKLSIRKVTNNWFHPPHIFSEIPDKETVLKKEKTSIINNTDKKIIKYLNNNPRASIREISQFLKIAALTAKKSLKKLKDSRAIIAFSTYFNPWLCGVELISISFKIKGRKNTQKVINKILSIPESGNIWEFNHEWNINVVFWVKEIKTINTLLNNIFQSCQGIIDTEILIATAMAGK